MMIMMTMMMTMMMMLMSVIIIESFFRFLKLSTVHLCGIHVLSQVVASAFLAITLTGRFNKFTFHLRGSKIGGIVVTFSAFLLASIFPFSLADILLHFCLLLAFISFRSFPSFTAYYTKSISQIIIHPKNMQFMEHLGLFLLS